MELFFIMCVPIWRVTCVWKKYIVIFHTITLEIMHSHPRYNINAIISSVVITDWPCVATYQMYLVWSARRWFGSTTPLAPRRSIAFRNSAGTWSRAPGKQFGVVDRWRVRHTRPAQWSDTLQIRPVQWRKWNRIWKDLARLADPIGCWHLIQASHWRVCCGGHYIEAEWCINASVNLPALVQIMACRLAGAKLLSKPMLEYC